jgi:hypothetical protein
MKRPILLALLLLVAPSAARAQLEVGLDAGFVLHTGFESSDDVTRISIPTGWGRLGLPLGDLLGFETLLGFNRISSGDSSASQLSFLPGVNVWLGDDGAYLRGEVAMTRTAFDGESQSQYGFGGAVGLKKDIDGGPVSFRLEGGFVRWLEDQDNFQEAFNQIRILVGISAAVGG